MRFFSLILFTAAVSFVALACSGGDVEVTADLYEYPGDGDESTGGDLVSDNLERVVIDRHDFYFEYRFDFEPRNADTECRFQEEEWFECESPYIFDQDSDDHHLEEGYLSFSVRAIEGEGDDERISDAHTVEKLVLFDFDFTIDGIDEFIADADDQDFGFPDEYTASCSRADDNYTPDGAAPGTPHPCEMSCQWISEDLTDSVDADCSFHEPFDLEFPDDDLEHAFLEVEACATDFGGDQTDEHCLEPSAFLFYPAPPAFRDITTGTSHTCAIVDEDDSLWCWGDNSAGQVGVDSDENSIATPREVATGPGVEWRTVSAGDEHTCGVDYDGTLYCWGENSQGQLGSDDLIDPIIPEIIDTGDVDGWLDVSAGESHTCAISDDEQLFCWGLNVFGQLGTDDEDRRTEPTSIQMPDNTTHWEEVSAGVDHTCGIAMKTDGGQSLRRGYCWGRASDGRLGNSTQSGQDETAQEIDITSSLEFQTISAGPTHTCAVISDEAYCWGNTDDGRLGHDDDVSESAQPFPQDVDYPDDWSDVISAGHDHSCGISEAGTAYCWGRSRSESADQLGLDGEYPEQVYVPHPVVTPDDIQFGEVSAGDEFTCGLTVDGVAYCWGGGGARLGTETDRESVPTEVSWPQGRFVPVPDDDDI